MLLRPLLEHPVEDGPGDAEGGEPHGDDERVLPALVGGAAQLGELSAAKEPRRAIVRFTPKAKQSSLPRNHFAMAVVTATMSDSAPRPNTSRPAAITAIVPPRR